MAALFAILLVINMIGFSSQSMNETDYIFLAQQHADRFEEAFRQAFKDDGVVGLRVYFTDDFEAINFQGLVYLKDQYLRHLSQYENATYWFFHDSHQVSFEFPSKHLIVRFYDAHVLYAFRLVPNRSLLGGYQIKRLALAEKV